ncbi:receptor-transporting protein 5 [Nannospalax galili]|uniref:receptor-transporting protein 5 n=1 Tax=Nannospalax galili TaxID=1026970 RepID=UPI00111C1CFB|nr:receptor-transporting protein 5 [Nannospalax galili]
MKTFELRGFLFGGWDSFLSPIGVARGQGPISFNNVPITSGNNLSPVFYIIGLKANGEGTVIFPFSLTNIIRVLMSKTLTNFSKDKEKESGQDTASVSHNVLLQINANCPICISEDTITIPSSGFSIIKCTGPSYMANSFQCNGFVTYGYKRRGG